MMFLCEIDKSQTQFFDVSTCVSPRRLCEIESIKRSLLYAPTVRHTGLEVECLGKRGDELTFFILLPVL